MTIGTVAFSLPFRLAMGLRPIPTDDGVAFDF
jgi:hypothetical protein